MGCKKSEKIELKHQEKERQTDRDRELRNENPEKE